MRPLPYPNSGRLLRVQESHPGGSNANFTYASYLDLKQQSKALENIAAFRPWSFNLTGEGEPQQVTGAMVSGNFFSALGIQPLFGRTISDIDNQPGGDNRVVVLSYALWQSSFGASREILGSVLRVSAENYRVIGVMPRGFDYPEQSGMWCPLVEGGALRDNRRSHLLTVIADLRPAKPLGSAQAEITTIAERIEQLRRGEITDEQFRPFRLKHGIYGQRQPGVQMVRVKVPSGVLNAAQLGNRILSLLGVFMSTKVHSSRSFFGHFLPAIPRDYIARRRMFRNIASVVMIVVLSLLVAGVIIYTSNPTSFGSASH